MQSLCEANVDHRVNQLKFNFVTFLSFRKYKYKYKYKYIDINYMNISTKLHKLQKGIYNVI